MTIGLSTSIILLLTLLPFSSALLQEVPGLYLDRVALWSPSGTSNGYVSGGYNFSVSWRSTLPGINKTALGLYNFRTGGGSILNFNAQLSSVSTSSATINVNPLGNYAGIVYLAYSILVVTVDNNYVELLTVVKSGLSNYYFFSRYFSVYSSKFTFGSSGHQVSNFIQWIKTTGGSCGSGQWYWIMLNLETVSGTSQIKVPFYQDNDIQQFKMNVIIVAQDVGSQQAAFYSTYSQFGDFTYSSIDHYSSYFRYNFNLNSTLFGDSTSGQRCLHGLSYIFLDCNRGYSSRINQCQFQMSSSGTQVRSIQYNRAEILKINTVCFGLCPNGTFFEQSTSYCKNCNLGCASCNSCGTCSQNMTELSSNCVESKQESSSSSSSVGLIIGIIFAVIIGIIILILICCACRRCKSSQDSNHKVSNMPNQSLHGFYYSQGVSGWKNGNSAELEDSMCPICLNPGNAFETACGHYYHVECIVEWSLKKKECGLCRQTLTGNLHRIYCIHCRGKYREMQFRQIEELYRKRQVSLVAICSDCKYRPKN